MKNRVRMHISRDLHSAIKACPGKTNDEKVNGLLQSKVVSEFNNRRVSAYIEKSLDDTITIKYLASALVVSISISCLAVGYVAKLQGWF